MNGKVVRFWIARCVHVVQHTVELRCVTFFLFFLEKQSRFSSFFLLISRKAEQISKKDDPTGLAVGSCVFLFHVRSRIPI
jgi:hypothetical protein